jgi:hypothetical protein
MHPQDRTTRPLVGFHSFTPYENPEPEHQDTAYMSESFRILNQLVADIDNLPSTNSSAPVVAPADAPVPRPRRRAPRLDLRTARAPRKSLAEMSALERHTRKCLVCRHRDREEIESDFLHWHDMGDIVIDYKLPNRRALYRHARATGLYELRMANIRDAASLIAAKAEHCRATASSVLKAIQACSQIDELGRWIEPPKQLIRYTVIGEPQPANVAREAAPSHDAPAPQPTEISNRHTMQLETCATPTKHSPAPLSNRPKTHTFTDTWSRLFHPQKSVPQAEAARP